jgi:hypothetical protein
VLRDLMLLELWCHWRRTPKPRMVSEAGALL